MAFIAVDKVLCFLEWFFKGFTATTRAIYRVEGRRPFVRTERKDNVGMIQRSLEPQPLFFGLE